MIKVVYDPDGSHMERARMKALGIPNEEDFNLED